MIKPLRRLIKSKEKGEMINEETNYSLIVNNGIITI